jgi:hypothetical protein
MVSLSYSFAENFREIGAGVHSKSCRYLKQRLGKLEMKETGAFELLQESWTPASVSSVLPISRAWITPLTSSRALVLSTVMTSEPCHAGLESPGACQPKTAQCHSWASHWRLVRPCLRDDGACREAMCEVGGEKVR